MSEQPPKTKTSIAETIAQVEEETENLAAHREPSMVKVGTIDYYDPGDLTREEKQAKLAEVVNQFAKTDEPAENPADDAEATTIKHRRTPAEAPAPEPTAAGAEKPESMFDSERMKGYMSQRNGALDQRAGELGMIEKGFRSLGEQYNKLGWKSKLGVGLGLGIGAGALAAVSMPAAIACMSGIAVQRIAGLASSFLKYEKSTAEGKWQKEKAMAKAIAQSAAMTGAMLLLVEGVKEGVQWAKGEEVHGWLRDNWPFGHHDAPVAPPTSVAAPAPEAAAPVAAPAPEVKVEMPNVEASAGHGYEYMMKRMWESLQEKHLDPNQYGKDTDIYKLLTADKDSIDGVVHTIARDSYHNFAHADGLNVSIDPTAHMTIGADGQAHVLVGGHDFSTADYDAPTTPAYHPHVAGAEQAATTNPAPAASGNRLDWNKLPSADSAKLDWHSIKDASMPTAHHDGVWQPEDNMGPNHPGEEFSFGLPNESPLSTHPAPVEHAIAPQAPAPHLPEHIAVNGSGVEINITEPHIYASHVAESAAPVPGQGIDVMNMPMAQSEHLFVYGGDPSQRAEAIQQYLSQHHDKVIYSADNSNTYRIPWHWADGKVVPGTPVRTSGFLGFFSSFMKAPAPDELGKLIK